jgi:large subunit ribosomal protein L10Ae
VCIIGSAAHCDQARAAGIDCIDVDGLKAFDKDKKKIKKWAKKYDHLLASDSLVKQVTKFTDKILVKMDKFPAPIAESEKVVNKIEDIRHTIRFRLKKVVCMGTAIGNVEHTEEQLRQNINMGINFLVSQLPKGWMNIRRLFIKTSMSKSQKIYG